MEPKRGRQSRTRHPPGVESGAWPSLQLPAPSELLEFTAPVHFSLGFLNRRSAVEPFETALPSTLQVSRKWAPQLGLTGLTTGTLWFTTWTEGGGNAAWAKIVEPSNALIHFSQRLGQD